MASDVQVKVESTDPCCALWKIKYSKLEEKRNALRQAVKLLELQIDKIQTEAKKVCEEERARANFEKEEKEKEASARLALTNEIALLKSEILSLKQRGGTNLRDGSSEVKALKALVSDGEREIKRLKEALQNERKKANSEKKKVSELPKDVEYLKSEKEIEEKCKSQTEFLRKEANEAKSKLASLMAKLSEANKKLEEEKSRAVKETKRADFEKSKAEEQRKLAEACNKQAIEVEIRADYLSRQLEENKKRIDEALDSKSVLELNLKLEEVNKKLQLEKRKASREKERADVEMLKAESQRSIADMNLEKAMEEKSRADMLCKRSEEDRQKIAELEKRVKELLPSRAASSVSKEELKLLKKQLKLEKMKKKHSKQVLDLEISRNSILQQELARLKLDFDQFSCRLGLLHNSFLPGSESRDDLAKNLRILDMPRSVLTPSFMAMDASGTLRHTMHRTMHSPLPEGNFVEPLTGINSELESLLGGSSRTMLKSPAINSIAASFSNGQLVGSQDKGAFSVTTSAKLAKENAQPTVSGLSDEATGMRCGENLAIVAENSVRGTLSNIDVDKVTGGRKKRKRLLDAVEAVENLYAKDKKLHLQMEEKLALLHGIAAKKLDKGFSVGKPPNFVDCLGTDRDKHSKKRKISFQEKVLSPPACGITEQKKIHEVRVNSDTKSYREASLSGVDLITTEVIEEDIRSFGTTKDFEELANGHYMNLLNLDDVSFEECYRAAIQLPLSPTLPEIEIDCFESQDVEIAMPLAKETLSQELSSKEEQVLSSQGLNIEIEISSSKSMSDGNTTSTNTLVDNWGSSHGEKPSVCLSHSVVQMENSNAIVSGDKRSLSAIEDEFGYLSDKMLEHCVVFSSSTDSSSICRIYYAIRACMVKFSLPTQAGWIIREILQAIRMEEQLLAKEKACALFSLLIINFSVAASGKFGDCQHWASTRCLDTFSGHVHSVMSDVETRSLLVQLGCLDELLNLMENFLMDDGVKLLRGVPFSSAVGCDSRDSIKINDPNISLSFIPVSAEQFIAGSIILGSVSVAIDHIGFMCETSYNILRARRLNNSLMLTIFHIFAYLGGDKFFSLSDYSLMMTVVKKIVRNIEALLLSGASVCCNPFVKDAQTEFIPCVKCPFLEDNGNAVSVDPVSSLLLEKIKAYDIQEKIDLQVLEQVYCGDKMSDCGTCSSKKYDTSGKLSDAFTAPETLSTLTDLLALMELVGCNMGWEWSLEKIVPQLLKLLESSVLKNSTPGVVILLGQLGRLGVETLGYEDPGVEQIRSGLVAFLRSGIGMEACLPIQIVSVTALLTLLSVDFETILQTNGKLPAVASNSESIDLIRKWFSLLTKKQQDMALNVFADSRYT